MDQFWYGPTTAFDIYPEFYSVELKQKCYETNTRDAVLLQRFVLGFDIQNSNPKCMKVVVTSLNDAELDRFGRLWGISRITRKSQEIWSAVQKAA